MRERITRIIEVSYLPLAMVFLLLSLLTGLGVILPLRYELFAYALPLLAIPSLLCFKPSANEKKMPAATYTIVVALLFAIFIRLLPLTRSSIPLGYDAGFYKYTMELYYDALPQIPEAGLALWIKQMYTQGLFVLSDILYVTAGVSAMNSIMYLFPLLGAFTILPLFVVTRNLFGQRTGVIAALLYAVSYTQYTTFTLLYFKNVFGLIFLLLAIYALEKKKDGLMAVMFAALGIFHRPEFLLFALILVPYFFLHRRRGIIIAALVTAALIAPFWIPRLAIYWGIVSETIGGGTFFDFETYSIVSLAYIPFAAIGTVFLLIHRKFNSILIYFVITCFIVIFQFFFYKRFIIMLDVATVIMAAVGIENTLLQKEGMRKAAGVAIASLVMIVSGLPTLTEANNIRPLITEKQLQAAEWIRDNTERDAYVLATSNDAPWVLGWSERRVIAPGLFEWYIQSKDEWFSFLESKDPAEAKKFMDAYDNLVYIYYSENNGNYMNTEKFAGGYFREVYHEEAVVYRYLGDSKL